MKSITSLLLAGGIALGGSSLVAQDQVLWTFYADAEGWVANTTNNDSDTPNGTVDVWVDDGTSYATDGDSLLTFEFENNDSDNFVWVIDVVVEQGTDNFDALWDAWQNDKKLLLDIVTIDGAGYTGWYEFFASVNPSSGEWVQIGPLPPGQFNWEDDVTNTYEYDFAGVQDPPAETPTNIKFILAFNTDGAPNGVTFGLDNIRIAEGGGGDDMWAGYAMSDGWVSTEAWLGWLYVDTESAWVFSQAFDHYIYLPEERAEAEAGAWIYSPAPAAAE